MSTGQSHPVGTLLRDWRQRRRMSQLDLACEAEISTRHLSFLETGRSQPSRDMLLHLAERLEVPLRERNLLLIAAGYAPVFPERSLDDPALQDAWRAISLVLAGHEPYPALAIDRHWTLRAANSGVAPLLAGIPAALLQQPVNVLRLSLHPEGLAPRIVNLAEWRAHVLVRLRRQIDLSGDPVLVELLAELAAYPLARGRTGPPPAERSHAEAVVSLQLITPAGQLNFFSTTMIFGTPIDITLSELALESFFPADEATAETMRRLASAHSPADPGRVSAR
jgi:transcriptional regulator with XRE-family HTH domain